MQILISGAGGFIGSRLTAELLNKGHSVVACGRRPERLRLQHPLAEAMACDFAKNTAADWRGKLTNVDAVINAAGIFRPHRGSSFNEIHVSGPAALFEACAAAGINKVIQISALGVGEVQAGTAFQSSKRSADIAFLALAGSQNLRGWTVVRPSLVIGRGGYSTALFAALAAFPSPLRLGDGSWLVQPIHIADLVQAVCLLLERESPAPAVLNAAGPEPLSTDDLTLLIRRWLLLPPSGYLRLPEWLLSALTPIARVLSLDALSKDSLIMLKTGNVAPASPIVEDLGWTPRPLGVALASEPSTEADLWHARLFFLRPAIRIGLALLWLITAIVSAFIYPLEKSAAMTAGLGVTGWQAKALVYAGAAADGFLGLALFLNIRPRLIGVLQIAAVVIFTVLASLAVPAAWIEPFGPLTKNLAVILATLVMIALEARR
jgi:nucleoside-diphosphate-sugar epimerase